ncbi:hypothetical protein [Pantoea cypripedii]|uniref:Uncharacterized protein n=1 Tax=Pantoea cypripedii TaxID=55209 RepID=A0A1X1EX70_PANCY|nr:hypothetical protein [Pantoea cypripedii]MBP2194685.1 hypothetical protein [Pantoea cypripedii]ORM94582.1 hypothetical protein HA50_14955 [Pantoea cypripedii]
MRSYSEIARRIAKIILSPESAIGFVSGVLSVPTDIGYLAFGFIDTESRYQRGTEKIRMLKAIRHGILENHNFIKTIEIVLSRFNKSVPESKQNAIYSKTMASVAGRTLTNSLIAGRLATVIAQRSSFLITIRGGLIGNTLLLGGMVERCIYTSERLLQSNPDIYHALRYRDFDLLYFLLEPALNPFIEALNIRRTQGQTVFEKILDMVKSEIHARR